MNNFLQTLTENLKNILEGLFIDNNLYEYIREFLYSPMKLLYIIPYNIDTIELPIFGVNYKILFDEKKLKQSKKNINLFHVINDDTEYIFEIIGDFSSFSYNGYYSITYNRRYSLFLQKLSSQFLKKVINYGCNPELKIINVSMCENINLPNKIPYIETFMWQKYTFSYGENIT